MNRMIRKIKLVLAGLLIASMLTTGSYPVMAQESAAADDVYAGESGSESDGAASQAEDEIVLPDEEQSVLEDPAEEDEEAVSEAATGNMTDSASADDKSADGESNEAYASFIDRNNHYNVWGDMSLIKLKSGNYERWIDRIDIPQFGYDLYEALEEGSDNDGVNDFLIEDAYFSDNPPAGSGVLYYDGDASVLRLAGSSEYEGPDYNDAVYQVVLAVVGAFKHDHPEVFWLSDQLGLTGGWKDDYYFVLKMDKEDSQYSIHDDIRDAQFGSEDAIRAGINDLNGYVDAILSDENYHPDGGRVDQIRFFCKWLEDHNEFNTSPNCESINYAHICLSALKGGHGEEGPACAGYSTALKVLCDRTGIPCILVTGNAKDYPSMAPAGHMWNYVKINNRWYAIDDTYNDMYSSYKKDNYLLVGSETIIKHPRGSMKFSAARCVTNDPVTGTSVRFVNGPVLNEEKFDLESDVEFVYSGTTGDLTWEFVEGENLLIISGDGNMADYDADEGKTSPWSYHNAGIKQIVIGAGVKHIGNFAFYGCSALETVRFDGAVESIGTAAFKECGRLTEMEIPDTVKSIGGQAFCGCCGLSRFEIPVSVTEIGGSAFAGTGIRDIAYAGTYEQWKAIVISDGETIYDDARIHCADKTVYYKLTGAESVTINPVELSLPVGDKKALSYGTCPEDAYTESVVWSSSDASVAGVERSTGIVTANKAGTAVVTVIVKTVSGSLSASCSVTVTDEEPLDVVYPTKITLSNKVSGIIAGKGSSGRIAVAKTAFTPSDVPQDIIDKTEVIVLDKNASKADRIKAEIVGRDILLYSDKYAPAGKYTIKLIAYAPKSAGQVVATMPLTVSSPIIRFGMSNWNPRIEYKGKALSYTIKPVFYGPDNSNPKLRKAVYEVLDGSEYVDGEIKNGKVKIKAGISLENGDKEISVRIKADDYSENNASAVVRIRLTKADGELGAIQFRGENMDGKTYTMLELNEKRLSLSNDNYDVTWSPAWKNNTTNYVADRYLHLCKPGSMTITAAAADGSKNKTSARIKIIYPKNIKYDLFTQNDSGVIKCTVFDKAKGTPAPAWLYGYTLKVKGGKVISSKASLSGEGILLIKPTSGTVTVTVGDKAFSINDVTTGETPKVKLLNVNGDAKAKALCAVKQYHGTDMHQYITCSIDEAYTGVEIKEAGCLSYCSGAISDNGKLKIDVIPDKTGTAILYVTLINADGKRANPAELKIKINKMPAYKVQTANYVIKNGISNKPVTVQGKLVIENPDGTDPASNISGMQLCNAVLLKSGKVNRFTQYFELDKDGFIKLKKGVSAPTDSGDLTGYVMYSYADANGRIRTNKDKITIKIKK